jgi:hypothetical protein
VIVAGEESVQLLAIVRLDFAGAGVRVERA